MNSFRRTQAWNKRDEANQLANQREHPRHYTNGDEQKFRHIVEPDHVCTPPAIGAYEHLEHLHEAILNKPSFLMSFTKGMPHNFKTGLLSNPQHFQYFLRAIDSGDPRDFRDTPLGPEGYAGAVSSCAVERDVWKSRKAKGVDEDDNVIRDAAGLRSWESQSAGLAFELEGPDAQAVTMPPAPRLGSAELTAEMAEVYVQALARDTPLNALSAGVMDVSATTSTGPLTHGSRSQTRIPSLNTSDSDVNLFIDWVNQLRKLDWFNGTDLSLNQLEQQRRTKRQFPTPSSAFRGITEGDDVGPYLSQFMLMGSSGINVNDLENGIEKGLVSYGAIRIDQKVRVAKEINYMTKWEEWFDVQNAANVGQLEEYVQVGEGDMRRFIYTGRDLATYVHYDALYEAYLNACLILLGRNTPFDPGIPFQENDNRDHQQGFAHFGGPHILSLVTEVATRALKAVRFQKYNVHRRCRPEVLAARLTKATEIGGMAPELMDIINDLGTDDDGLLTLISDKNGPLFESDEGNTDPNYLLPMAFCEGSPMHPAYGAGHATVAGACVTILKAFFDSKAYFKPNGVDANKAYVSINNGSELALIDVYDRNSRPAHLTVEGELNKLASNISIGRDWAGVHYFTDYYESLLMGEKIAIGILEEQKLMFGENFSMTVPLFDGRTIRI